MRSRGQLVRGKEEHSKSVFSGVWKVFHWGDGGFVCDLDRLLLPCTARVGILGSDTDQDTPAVC